MVIIYDEDKQKNPIKVWLEDKEQLDEDCIRQALNLSNLPFLHKWVCLMPDTHSGYGMPIGGVIAAKDAIIPNAVGVDIGCGMAFVETDIHRSNLSEKESKKLVKDIMKYIPTGFDHHKKKQNSRSLDKAIKEIEPNPKELFDEIEKGYYQLGTLGGGNHFIEIQEDEKGFLGIMIHSGSRNFGYKIANYFNNIAKELSDRWKFNIPKEYDLAYLPTDSKEGQLYIKWMNLALDFAKENREKMMSVVKDCMTKIFPNIEYKNEVYAHHNYAAYENYYNQMVWVHRKGAIRVRKGELGIIPGAMGSYSYIVEGLGNPESFYSCSHGAGRRMSRNKARKEFPMEMTISDLENQGVILGKKKKSDVSDECKWAYKDIDFVISQELDLIKPVKRLKTVCVVKG
jgi:tRNA-splicing ligase RtcB